MIEGHPDPVEALFSDAGLDRSKLDSLDGKQILAYSDEYYRLDYYYEPPIVKIISPEGLRLPCSIMAS